MYRIFFATVVFLLMVTALTADEKSTDKLIEDFQREPAEYQEELQERLLSIQEELSSQLFNTEPALKNLQSEVGKTQAAYRQAVQTFVKNDPKALEIQKRMEVAEAEWRELRGLDGKRQEIDLKRRTAQNLRWQLRDMTSAVPAIKEAERLAQTANAKYQESILTAVVNSNLPQAKDFLKILAALEEAEEETEEENPFAGLYANLDNPPYSTAKYQEENVVFYEKLLRQENPDADPDRLKLFCILRCQGDWFPADAPVSMKKEKGIINETFRVLNAMQKKKVTQDDAIKRIQEMRLETGTTMPFTRLALTELLKNLCSGNIRKMHQQSVNSQWIRLVKEKAFELEEYPIVYSRMKELKGEQWVELDEYFQQQKKLNGWMRAMIEGRASIKRAWAARGGGYADTVSAEGWRTFRTELHKARAAFLKAVELNPKCVSPYRQLVIVEMGCGTLAGQIRYFKEAIQIQPDFMAIYENIIWGMLPRWGGSHQLLLQLSDTMTATERYDLPIPAAGFDIMGDVVRDYSDYSWKNIYRRSGVAEKAFRHYRYHLEQPDLRIGWKHFILMHKMLFEMALLRYDDALSTRQEIKLNDEELSAFWRKESWRGSGLGEYIPRMPSYMDPVPLLKLFTGKQGKQLQQLEREYLDGDKNSVCTQLYELIRTGSFSEDERQILADLYGRYRLPEGGDSYYSGNNNRDLFNSFEVAIRDGNSRVVRELLELKFNYSANESYPGRTAIMVARSGTDPDLLNTLKEAGDPLNRPEPEHGRTPIHVACYRPNTPMMKRLLELGASPTAASSHKHTPIHFSAAAGDAEAVRLLLAAGADPDARDADGDTPLMFAIERKRPKAVWEPLIKATKDVNIRNNSGRSALDYAKQHGGSPELLKALAAKGAR